MSLKVDIKYKSNAQQGSLRGQLIRVLCIGTCELKCWTAKRKNKWICALKDALAELRIYGPAGNPSPKPSTSRYTLVPWELISEEDRAKGAEPKYPLPTGGIEEPRIPDSNWHLTDSNIALVDGGGDVFDEGSEVGGLGTFLLRWLLRLLRSFGCVTHRGEPIALPSVGVALRPLKTAFLRGLVLQCPILFTDPALRFLRCNPWLRRSKCIPLVPPHVN